FFHQSRDEIEIRLAVLHAIFARLERSIKAIGEICQAIFPENLRDEVGNGNILKDATIGGPGQRPERGDERGVISSEMSGSLSAFERRRVSLREGVDDPVDVAFRPVGEKDCDSGLLTDYRIEGYRAVFRMHRQLEMKVFRDALFAVEALKQERVHAERRIN